MALVGRFEDLPLAELLQVLSLFEKSGKLTLSRERETGLCVFNKGKIFHAVNDGSRPFLGNVLLEKDLVTRETLDQALAVQKTGSEWSNLGTVLVDMGAITKEILDGVLRGQLEEIIEEFLRWDSGFFSFEPLTRSRDSEVEPEEGETTSGPGGDPDQLILEVLNKVEQVGSAAGEDLESPESPSAAGPSGGPVRDLVDRIVDPGSGIFKIGTPDTMAGLPDDLAELREMVAEIQRRPASFSSDIALMILRFATRVVNRGVLFGVSPEGISGMGQFGVGENDEDSRLVDKSIRQIVIPKQEPSVFFDVIERLTTVHGPLERCKWNNYLVDQLGGNVPPSAVAIPIVVDGRILAIFYGDNLPGGHPITSIHGLELLMIEAGLAIEKNLLREKLRSVETRVQAMSGRRENVSED